ncbi:MAG: hypothetical protein RLY21_44 [Planctomycetota bacterium]|jgi:glycosyltransferase involved in cell wall biosynthesis
MILHIIEDLHPESGGPPAVVIEFARHQALAGTKVGVACIDGPRDAAERERIDRTFLEAGVDFFDLSRDAGGSRKALRLLIERLRPRIVHLHGVWGGTVRHGAASARIYRIPYVVSTHGMLHPYALAQRALKKRIYLAIFPRIIGDARELFALNREEATNIVERFRAPASVLPNGIATADYEGVDPAIFRQQHPAIGSSPFVLFVGRLHPIKGVDNLVRSYAIARSRGLTHELVIVGPEDGGGDAAREAASAAGVAKHVHFVGPAYGIAKRSALAACSAFVHRPRFEGFGLAVVEALASAKPVVTTDVCRLDGAVEAQALVSASDTDEGFADALVALLHDENRARQVAAKGKSWVLREFDWSGLVERAELVYARIGHAADGR